MLITGRMPHRIMEFDSATGNNDEGETNPGTVGDGNHDVEDEESMMARVLLESQSSFLLEQQNIYQSIITADTKVESNICRHNSNDFTEDITNDHNSFLQWYDYRQYNSSRNVSSDQENNAAHSDYASIRDFIIDDVYDDENVFVFKEEDEEKEEIQQSHFCGGVDDAYNYEYTYEQAQSFRKPRSRPRYRSNENDYNKMPSQSSIFTSSTCAETTTTTASTAHQGMETQQEDIESEFVTSSSSSSFISDDMVILEQIRILRAIQEQKLLQVNRHHQSTKTTLEDITSFHHSNASARNDASNNFLDENCAEASALLTMHQGSTELNGVSNATSSSNAISEMAAMYNRDVILSYPDGTTTVRVRGIPQLQCTTLESGRLGRRHKTNDDDDVDEDDHVITTQCTHCMTLSQVVSGTCPFLFCVQCEEISPIVPISRSDVIDILERQQQHQQQE